ncbi:MAG: DEAD/DEAH box helicase family protein [Planctomycetes bacterium]|nr:DEAD/DEAH box helicase family protein [Planctomycetota bacterium]
MPKHPEELAREKIDSALAAAGWSVQRYRKFDPSVGPVALTDVPLVDGVCDYLLVVGRAAIGIVEAKKAGTTLAGVAEQSRFYGDNLPDFFVKGERPRFFYESTGVETFFRDVSDPDARSRRVFAFHRPETLAEWASQRETLRARLARTPGEHPLARAGLRECQVEAIESLERSLAEDRPRALIQMATGSGKTYTACAFVERLIRHGGARRVLFLVDRANLGRQAKGEFEQFVIPGTNRKFTELYNVQHLTSNHLDHVARVTIATIQRLYSMLRGEELPEDLDERSGFELGLDKTPPKDIAYNPALPIETFDFIVTDECHRSIYNVWRQVLEYFDAHLIGLTATPSKQTIGFFGGNLVTEYGHERAVADGVNVGYEVYRIKTEVTERGATVEKGLFVDRRDRKTRARRWEELDDDLTYDASALDRSVVVPSQIRTVLQAFKDALPELFPGRELVPKTLVFCKDDSHAEDVVQLAREVFGKGNDFAKKITYNTYDPETKRYAKSDTLIAEFRTSPTLRIAVTVDMIATGTDIRPLECLLFLRDVKSRIYFEQMKGRGTRVLTPTDLQAVSGSDARAKTHFVIVDAVGVCESDKTDSRPLEKKPTVALDKILIDVAFGKRDEDTLSSLAGRLARLDRAVDDERRREIEALAGGRKLSVLARDLLRAHDPDEIAAAATGKPGASPAETSPERFDAAQKALIDAACAPFDKPALREALVLAKKETEQTIDVVTIDEVVYRGFDPAAKEKAASLVRSFREYIEAHRAEIDALKILYSRPYGQRLTESMLKELEKKLRAKDAAFNEELLWSAFAATKPERVKGRTQVDRFADLVPLVRFALEREEVLAPFADSVRVRFEQWLGRKRTEGVVFSEDQRAWLELVRDHVATSLSIEPGDLDYAPFHQQGGRGRAHQLFGGELAKLLDELNEVLAA